MGKDFCLRACIIFKKADVAAVEQFTVFGQDGIYGVDTAT